MVQKNTIFENNLPSDMPSYTHTDLQSTIIALSTAPGVGALAVIRLSGKEAITACNKLFKGPNLNQQDTHTIHYGHLVADKQVIDEVMVALFKAPRSYTTEDIIEISCHGSPYIIQRIIETFLKEPTIRMAKPGEFTMRAFLNGRIDLSQAEAVADLIASESEAAHQVALQQMRGGFASEIKVLREQLINFASLIELELDFSEEDVAFADRQQLVDLVTNIQQLIQPLLNSFLLGNAIKNGVTTVIAGRPNAGKSTLLNALLNEERAIVSNIPGTTRDTIEEMLNINGIRFRLVDTAGIREAQDQIEAIGVQKTLEKIKSSSVVVYVFDLNEMSLAEVKQDLQNLQQQSVPCLVVGNKMDTLHPLKVQDWKLQGAQLFGKRFLMVSAAKKQQITLIQERLYQLVLGGQAKVESTVVSNLRHYKALQEADAALHEVLHGIEGGISGELLALDIRMALHHLGEITGEVTTDDLLGNIFSNFCIGK